MDFDLTFFTKQKKPLIVSKPVGLVNKFLQRYKLKLNLTTVLDHATDMVSFYQKMNFYHLLNQVLVNKIPGEIVELGCFEGQTAMLIQGILEKNKSHKKFFIYDNFKHQIGLPGDIKLKLIENFKNSGLRFPNLIEGSFTNTIPEKLPEQISFLHIDCGFGGNPEKHKMVVLHCLNSCYPRMSVGAIGVMMDYHDVEITVDGGNSNPGVKLACDEFFANKPEKMNVLYGGEYSHAYFIKGKVH